MASHTTGRHRYARGPVTEDMKKKLIVRLQNDEDLEPLLREISNDWDSYKHIAENAYNKAMQHYTCKRTFDMIKNKELF